MPAYPDLSGQHVFVTGAARGLGRSMAEKLAACGATVAAADVDEGGCDEVVKGIRAAGGAALAYTVDVAVRDEFMRAAAQFAAACGRIDAVVNNAMLLLYEPVEKIMPETLSRMTAIGINGSVWGAQALLKHYDAARGGAIVNMASPVAEKGFPNTAAYSLVKGAIVTLTKVLAAELGPRNVRVNAIAPGSVPTPGALGLNDKAEYARRVGTIPLRRLGREQDNAEACAFLLSGAASFINGEILHVDGGIAAAG
ncbi:MAG: SDR family NAD(P)-dependent oxidoreductase [Steroidobacteraceae bacterium]